jgi:hypothetical protein
MRRSRRQARASRPRPWALVLSAAIAGCGGSSSLDDLVPEGGALASVTSSVGGRSVGTTPVAGGAVGIGANPAIGVGGASITIRTGGAPSTGTGATGAQPCCGGLQSQGYVVSGPWHGYAWTAAVTSVAAGAVTTTINPPDFSGVAAGASELCAWGSVGPASDYGGVALLGVNVNQPQLGLDGGDPPVKTAPIGGIGITVSYTNPGGSVIRVQIQTPLGESSPTGRWCAALSGAGGTETVTWDMFWGGVADTTQGCWNAGGAHPPLGTEISNVALLVPGGNATAVPYSFCLQGIVQAG